MKHRLTMIAMACGITATSAVWAQGYTVMGGGAAPPPPPPGQAVQPTLVVQPAPSAQVAPSTGGGTTVLSRGVIARRPEEYGGVTPGTPAVPPGFRRARRPRVGSLVAWPGFQVVPGGSRVFVVLTTQMPVTDAGRNGRTRVFHIPGARISLSNNRRPLITEAFNTPVSRAYLRPARGGTDVVMELRADVEPSMSQETNGQGYNFVYFNFPSFVAPEQTRIVATSGDMSPVARPAVVAPTGATPAVVVGTPRPGADTERPPGVR
jgi:hypothetical protein